VVRATVVVHLARVELATVRTCTPTVPVAATRRTDRESAAIGCLVQVARRFAAVQGAVARTPVVLVVTPSSLGSRQVTTTDRPVRVALQSTVALAVGRVALVMVPQRG
jgi:hypothetical protein